MSPAPPTPPPILLTADELQERLAAKTTANLALLGRIAQRVVEEETARRMAGKPGAGPELLVERAMQRVAAAVPVLAPPTSEDEPFALASEAPELALDGETPFHTEPTAVAPPPVPAPEPEPMPQTLEPSETPPQLFNLEAFPDQPQRRWVRGVLWVVAGGAALLGVAAGIFYLSGNFPMGVASPPEPAHPAAGAVAPRSPALAERQASIEPTVLPTVPPTPVPTAVPPTPRPTEAPTPGPPKRPTRVPRAVAADAGLPAPVPALRGGQSRAGLFATPDWHGGPFYAIHFSSYRDRAAAERDAHTLSAQHGLPAKVLSADLGAEGVWYRVMLGEFDDEEQALQVRNELAARGTPDLGYVFKVVAKR